VGTRLSDSIELTSDVIDVIRNVVSDLRPAALDDYGLQAVLKSYIADYVNRFGIQVQLDQPDTHIPRLEAGVAMTVVRIVQEALTNVVRHAQAKHVQVSMRMSDNTLHLVIQDDGVGIANTQARPTSHGLKIMRERAEAFGGSLNIGMAPEGGTRVVARIPIQTDTTVNGLWELDSSLDA
jgi:signal transduction histidine kinase